MAASGKLSLYTNGTLAAQITTALRPIGNLIPQDAPGIGIGNVNDGFNNFPYVGDIDEVSLYNRALAAEEIKGLYNAYAAGKCLACPPVITIPPTNQIVALGSNAVFTVLAGLSHIGLPVDVQRDQHTRRDGLNAHHHQRAVDQRRQL